MVRKTTRCKLNQSDAQWPYIGSETILTVKVKLTDKVSEITITLYHNQVCLD